MEEFDEMKSRLAHLTEWYNKLTSPSSPASIKRQLESKVILASTAGIVVVYSVFQQILQRIEEGRRAMGMDVVVRTDDGKRATDSNSGMFINRWLLCCSMPT